MYRRARRIASIQLRGCIGRYGARKNASALAARRLPDAYGAVDELVAGDITGVVVVCRYHAVRLANQLAAHFSGATIHLFTLRELPARRLALLNERVRHTLGDDPSERAEYLSRIPAPQVIVDVAVNRRAFLRRFKELFEYVAPGGVFVLDYVRSQPSPSDTRLAELDSLAAGSDDAGADWSAELVASCGGVEFRGALALATKQTLHRIKLRDQRATGILTDRYGAEWGEVVATRPARRFTPRADLTVHGDRGNWYGQIQREASATGIDVPLLSLRRYTEAVCWPEQRVARDNYWLPDTFRHPLHRNLVHRRLIGASPWLARLPDAAPQASRHVEGPLFYFDTEYPAHYGHVLTEVISRYWGWQRALAIEPELRPLVSLRARDKRIPSFQEQIFTALGINVERIEYIAADEAVTVSNLYAASPMFSMPTYVSPEVSEPWAMIGKALYRPGVATPERLFVARRPRRIRSCLNTAEVEAFFKELGFELFYPEDHSFADQVTAFNNAEIVAGFAGSNLLTAMFAPGKKMISITADTFTAINEFLIASVVGGELHSVIGDAETKHPPRRWTWAAYQSNFTVDLNLLTSAVLPLVGEQA